MTKVVRALPLLSFRFHLGGPFCARAARLRALRSRRHVSRPVATTKTMTRTSAPSTRSKTGLIVSFTVLVADDEPPSAEDDQQAERDARRQRAQQVPEQQALGVGQDEHDHGGREQRRVERGGQGEQQDPAHASPWPEHRGTHLWPL